MNTVSARIDSFLLRPLAALRTALLASVESLLVRELFKHVGGPARLVLAQVVPRVAHQHVRQAAHRARVARELALDAPRHPAGLGHLGRAAPRHLPQEVGGEAVGKTQVQLAADHQDAEVVGDLGQLGQLGRAHVVDERPRDCRRSAREGGVADVQGHADVAVLGEVLVTVVLGAVPQQVVGDGVETRVCGGDGAATLVLRQLPGLVPAAQLDQLDLARRHSPHLVALCLVHDAQLVSHLALVDLALGLHQRVDDDEALEVEGGAVRVQDLVCEGRRHLTAVRLAGNVQVPAALPGEHDEELAERLDQRTRHLPHVPRQTVVAAGEAVARAHGVVEVQHGMRARPRTAASPELHGAWVDLVRAVLQEHGPHHAGPGAALQPDDQGRRLAARLGPEEPEEEVRVVLLVDGEEAREARAARRQHGGHRGPPPGLRRVTRLQEGGEAQGQFDGGFCGCGRGRPAVHGIHHDQGPVHRQALPQRQQQQQAPRHVAGARGGSHSKTITRRAAAPLGCRSGQRNCSHDALTSHLTSRAGGAPLQLLSPSSSAGARGVNVDKQYSVLDWCSARDLPAGGGPALSPPSPAQYLTLSDTLCSARALSLHVYPRLRQLNFGALLPRHLSTALRARSRHCTCALRADCARWREKGRGALARGPTEALAQVQRP